MKREDYISIRNRLALSKKRWSLVEHIVKDAFVVSLIALLWQNEVARFFAFPLLSVLIFRSFSMMHDAVHGAVSQNKIINSAAGVIYGGIGLLPYAQWKDGHLKHHFWSGNMEKDPVMAILVNYPNMSPVLKAILGFGWKHWLPTLSLAQHLVFWILSARVVLKEKTSFLNVVSILSPFLIFGSIALMTPSGFVPYTLIPALLVYLLGTEVINVPHHVQLVTMKGEEKFKVWDQYHTARSCVYPKWISKHIVLNFNLHAEHHMFPDAPWYHLDKIHKEVREALGSDLHRDENFKWILSNRKKSFEEVLFDTKTKIGQREPA